ncbi:MAG: PEP-CTERM sorting domain-containing protein [Planctomycetaceae bacterium]|nr:PEP-CTERM sorting domain-containing protein [Planctomycetaceae bacterium]
MKQCLILILVVLGLAVSANADYYVAGDFNGWDAVGNLMTDNGDGTYAVTITGLVADSRHEFKVTIGDWSTAYPGDNSWLYADASGSVDITFNSNWVADGWKIEQYRIGESTDPGSWTLAGSFQGWNNAEGNMTPQGGGIYLFSQTLSAGEHWFKPVVTGTWDSIAENGRSGNTWNMYVNLASASVVNVYVDALNGVVKTEVVPEPATMTMLGLGSLLMAIRRRK